MNETKIQNKKGLVLKLNDTYRNDLSILKCSKTPYIGLTKLTISPERKLNGARFKKQYSLFLLCYRLAT